MMKRDARKERKSIGEKGHEKDIARQEGDAARAGGQQFFKVFLLEQSGERLKIPPTFHEFVAAGPDRVVSLKGPSGNTWNVVLTSGPEGLGFTKGWKEFAHDHSLMSGHFLVFTYDGHLEFSVMVFSASGVKDKATLKVQPRNNPIVQLEEEEGDADGEASDTSEAMAGIPMDGSERRTTTRFRLMSEILRSRTTPKIHSLVQRKRKKRKSKYMAGSSNVAPPVSDRNKDELSSRNNIRVRPKDVPRMGKFASKKFRQPAVISQRCLVTEEDKNNALERANKFKSIHPFAVQIMMES